MLSTSSQTQRHQSEEDSSGSDAGSEVSLEPETDRFGFILTNRSTAGTVGPSPELVRQREAKWINIMGQWDRILLKKSNKVKLQCQKGIPASLRAKCWPLLCGATDRMRQKKNLYESLDSQPGLQSWVDIIERDLDRQFPFHEMFLSKDGHGQRGLFRVLKAYTQFQPEEGYCQAQGPVAAVLLMNMPAEEAFWCLVQISERYLPGYYSPLLEGVLFDAAILSWVLKKTCPAAHKHLQQHGVEPLMFATDWLMCLFTRHLPFNTLLRVWDLFFCYGVRVLLQVAVVLVRRVLGRAEQRKQCPGQMETLERLRGVREHVQEQEESFVAEVCSVPVSGKDLEKRTEKEWERWRKDKPSSAFDPRGRCYGYRMAWARARQQEEDRERKERETCNLSVPLARSASTLSLSPALLHKRFRKGGKANAGEWESGTKVSRHLSMGAKDGWKNWSNVEFNKVQGVKEEDIDLDGQKSEIKIKVEEESQQEEHKNSPTDHKEETVKVEEQIEPLKAEIRENEESKEMGESPVILEKTEDSQSVENNSQTVQQSHRCEDKGKLVDPNQPQVLEEQNHTYETEKQEDQQTVSQLHVVEEESNKTEEEDGGERGINEEAEKPEDLQNIGRSHVLEEKSNDPESEVIDTNEEAENSAAENKNTTIVDENHSEIQKKDTNAISQLHTEQPAGVKLDAGAETENSQRQQLDVAAEVSETRSETNLDTDSHGDLDPKTDTQQERGEVIADIRGKCHSTESLAEMEKAESHAQTETDVLAENADAQDKLNLTVPQKEPEEQTGEDAQIPSAPESTLQGETDAQATVEESVTDDPAQEIEKMAVLVQAPSQERVSNQTQDKTEEEEAELALHSERGEILVQDESVIATDNSAQIKISTPEIQTPEQSLSGAAEDAESTENAPESKDGEDDVLVSPESTAKPSTDSNTEIQDKSHEDREDLPELSDSSQEPPSRRRSSRSSGDFRLRKSSISCGSRVQRRLSEDLFTFPEKANQSPCSTSQPELALEEEKQEQTVPEASQNKQQPDNSKRFGLFRKLKGEQPKKAKTNKKPKMQVPKILIQDFSDVMPAEELAQDDVEEKLSSRERRRRRREEERKEKEEEKLKKKKEKEQEREKRKPQTRGKSFQGKKDKVSEDVSDTAKTGPQITRHSAAYAESYF